MNLIMGFWGDIKTAKTSFGLSFPRPLIHIDLDLGWERAEWRIVANKIRVPYNAPIADSLRTLDDVIISKPYQIPIRWPGAKVDGMINIWNEVVSDVFTAYSHPQVQSVFIDTGTVTWQLATGATLERVQETNPKRQNLIQIEYARPNAEMRALYTGARSAGKNLAISHQVGGVYKPQMTPQGIEEVRVGDTWAGFSGMGSIVDIVGRTWIETSPNGVNPPMKTPHLQIETCGLTLDAEGIVLPDPSYDAIKYMLEALRR